MQTDARCGTPIPIAALAAGAILDGGIPADPEGNPYETAIVAPGDAACDQAFRLRYDVYCVERGFKDPAHHPWQRETDEFDSHAVHGLVMDRASGRPAGTVRLVLPLTHDLDHSFPLQQICAAPLPTEVHRLPLETLAEISRMSISKNRRSAPPPCSAAMAPGGEGRARDGAGLRKGHPVTLELMRTVVRMSVDNGITHWCALMRPALLRLLAGLGCHFEALGPLVNVHGWRQPCHGPVEGLLARCRRERPDVWSVITEGGRLAT